MRPGRIIDSNEERVRETMEASAASLNWTILQFRGQVPVNRLGAAHCPVGEKHFVYGGLFRKYAVGNLSNTNDASTGATKLISLMMHGSSNVKKANANG